MRSVAFLSQKGGSGKTTLAVHVAVAACEAQEKVVLIDSDPQGSAAIGEPPESARASKARLGLRKPARRHLLAPSNGPGMTV